MEAKARSWKMENCVKWSQFIGTLLTIILVCSGVFVYIMKNHEGRPHVDAVEKTQFLELKTEMTTTREQMQQTRETMAKMSVKIDGLTKALKK